VEDGSWYGGDPIWVLAEKQGIKTASFFWIGTEANIQGIHPSYYKLYNASIPHNDRIEQIIDWLKLPEPERPQFLTLYFSLIDDVGHNYGPDSEEMKDAVHKIDNDIGILMKKISVLNLPVNLIIVSDHGMSTLDQDNPIYLEYTETQGHPELRDEISKLYQNTNSNEILVFSGAEEGVFVALNALLSKNDHVIIQHPYYQSQIEIPLSIGCDVTKWEMKHYNNWKPDLDILKDLIKANTKAIIITNPSNPTGI